MPASPLSAPVIARLGLLLARLPLTLCSPGGAGILTTAGASWRQLAPICVALARAAIGP